MTVAPSFTALNTSCLFCDPEKHGQGGQIMLASDSYYLFAGLGAISDGYTIVAPYDCSGGRSIAEIPYEQLDELRLLRELVAHYYRDRYGQPGLSFEHGRAGVCTGGHGSTPHCYHAHLCCYPVDVPLWEHMAGMPVEEIDGMHELRERVGSAPYLYVESCRASEGRETWTSRIARLPNEADLESQYLRRVLATTLGVPEHWDWRVHPTVDLARKLVSDFRDWLAGTDRYAWQAEPGRPPTLNFRATVAKLNAIGNNAVARRFFSVWHNVIQHDVVARFVRRLPVRDDGLPPRVLDAACGPASYLKAFHHLGLRGVGADISPGMLDMARVNLGAELAAPNPPWLTRMDVTAPAFGPGSFDGIWLSAALVHIPRTQARELLNRLRDLLTGGGTMYVSAQVGRGLAVRLEGRVFVYYGFAELRALFRACGLDVTEQWAGTTDRGSSGDGNLKVWQHFLLTRSAVVEPARALAGSAANTLADLGEHSLLDHIRDLLPAIASDALLLGVGDDATAVRAATGEVVVASVDPCPQPVISLLEAPDPWVDGWYSMVINISDLAAMGAQPIGALLAVEAPPDHRLDDLDRFYAGVLAAAEAFECPVLGGNLKDGPRFGCVGVALGQAPADRLLRRDTALPGQIVLVLGPMGRFWAAVLQSLHAIRVSPAELSSLRQALRQPVPRVREGGLLAERGWSNCAMDSSDGVTDCLYRIARASGVDLHVDLTETPVEPMVAAVARACAIDVRKLLLAWGDWQLVCTVDPANVTEIRSVLAALDCPAWEIGWVGQGAGRVWLHEADWTEELNYVASERFSTRSYFTHGIAQYERILRDEPLTRPSV